MGAALNKVPVHSGDNALNKVPVLSSALTMPIEEVADALGLTSRALMRKHKRMSADHGFPPPLPGGVWRWSRSAFETWVRANGAAPAENVDEASSFPAAKDRGLRLVAEQNASLRARYSGGGR